MQLHQLIYILEVEKTGSMNKAAKNLFVSQPNLSSSISNLEKELNVQIFKRTNKGVEITPDGKLIVQQARGIVLQVDQIKKIYNIEDRSHVAFLEISQTGMIDLSGAISKIYNQISGSKAQITIKEDDLGEVIKHLYYMKSEIAVVTMNSSQRDLLGKVLDKRKLELNILTETKLGIVVSQKSPLYKREEVSLEELNKFTYIEYLEERSFLLNYNVELVEIESKFLTNVIRVADRSVLQDLLGKLDAYSLNVEQNTEYLAERGLKFIRLKEDVNIYVGWLKRKREQLSYEGSLFIEELTKSIGYN